MPSMIASTPGLQQDLDFFLLACRSERRSPSTLKDYKSKSGRLLRFLQAQGVENSCDITPHHIRAWMVELSETMQMSSVADYVRVARRWFNWMVEEGMLQVSPTAHVKPPRTPVHVIQPLSLDQLNNLLALCDHDAISGHVFAGVRNRAILLVLVDTGMRRAEVARMQLSDFNEDVDRIRVRAGKTHEERIVALHPTTQRAILRYLIVRSRLLVSFNVSTESVWITRRAQPLVPMGITNMVSAIGKRAGITSVRCSPHTFRHTAGTLSLLNGASEREVRDMLGHKSDLMAKRYTATVGSEHAAERHRTFSPVGRLRRK